MDWKKIISRKLELRDKRGRLFMPAVKLCQENLRLAHENRRLQAELLVSKEREIALVNASNEHGRQFVFIQMRFDY
jgi:hypothetical protein